MSILSFLQIFESYWNSTVLYFLPGIITFKMFALILAVLSALVLAREIMKKNLSIRMSTIVVALISVGVVLLYLFTSLRYTKTSGYYKSYLLAVTGQLVPGVITATFVSDSAKVQTNIKRITPIVVLILSFVSMMSVFFPTSVTTGGYTDNENGLNYQTASYVAAYMAAFAEYCLLTRNESFHFKFIRSKFGALFLWLIIFVDFITLLLSGGRGGFVAFVFFAGLSLFFALKKKRLDAKTFAKGAGLLVVAVVAVYIIIRFVMNSSLTTSGFSRIVGLVSGNGDVGRATIRENAINSFKESVLIGHGFGSVFNEIGIYSHNLFTDALVEAGMIGLFVLLFILGAGAIKAVKMVRLQYSNIFWIYIFFCGFVMSMFSGYWLAHFPLWWGLVFILTYNKKKSLEN